MKNLKKLLPDFPRTFHLPYKFNATHSDLVANEQEVKFIFEDNDFYLHFEDKIDGSQCGMALIDGEAVIRNRSHILKKGYVKETAAKKQFASSWNWFYDNKSKFQKLESLYPHLTVYGEWTYALHGIRYDQLPSYFISYDLYDQVTHQFLATQIARQLLEDSGFDLPKLLHVGKINSWQELDVFLEQNSEFSSLDKREGIYLKVSDKHNLLKRYKIVRSDYVQGSLWNPRIITKNVVYKGK